MARPLDVDWCRRQFPGLARKVGGQPAAFFDGPAGSQVPQRVIDAMGHYLAHTNANHGGAFATSRESDVILAEAHQAVADLLGVADPREVSFGANMTTLTFAFSRALARTWRPGDEIVLTHLEHDANASPWLLAARDAGVTVRWVRVRRENCTLDITDLACQLTTRTRLLAVCAASNAVGTINPLGQIVQMAHAAGAQVFVDAVHYVPHLQPCIPAWDCDYVVCSAYKFFGPHVGILWGRGELMGELPAYKVRPASNDPPGKWMTGTQNHEGLAGVVATVDYLADLGCHLTGQNADRRTALAAAYEAIKVYERTLAEKLILALQSIPGVHVLGISDLSRLDRRVPTVSFVHARKRPREVAEYLGERGIFVWAGNCYALPFTEAMGLEPDGFVRVGLLHYNTSEEISRLQATLAEM